MMLVVEMYMVEKQVLSFIFMNSMNPIQAFESVKPPEDVDLHSDRPLALHRAARMC